MNYKDFEGNVLSPFQVEGICFGEDLMFIAMLKMHLVETDEPVTYPDRPLGPLDEIKFDEWKLYENGGRAMITADGYFVSVDNDDPSDPGWLLVVEVWPGGESFIRVHVDDLADGLARWEEWHKQQEGQ